MGCYGLSQLQLTEKKDQLDEVVEEITREYPSCGEGLLKQILADRGIKVQRMRLRDSVHRVDHKGVENRKKGRLRRRTYDVQGSFLQKIAYIFDHVTVSFSRWKFPILKIPKVHLVKYS